MLTGAGCSDHAGSGDAVTPVSPFFACTLEQPAPLDGADFPMTVGLSIKPPGDTGTYAGVYTAVQDGAEIEIVKGVQCGVHLELAFTAELPDAFIGEDTPVAVVRARTYMDCKPEGLVAEANLQKYLAAGDEAGGSRFTSGQIQVRFEDDEPGPYADRDCCVVMTVGARLTGNEAPAFWGCDTRRFRCVDRVTETECKD